MPDTMSEYMSDRMPDRRSECMPDRMPHRMSDRMSEYYESQPVGLAEVIDASEASLGGPGGRPSQMSKNRVK